MKPLIILIIGCVPLAVLTVWGFVELAAVDDQLDYHVETDARQAAVDLAGESPARTEIEKPLVKALADADLFAAEPIKVLQTAPDGSSLKPVGDTWPQWMHARGMVTGVLEAEQAATGTDLEQLKDACRQLEELKQKYEADQPRGSQRLLQLLGRRHARLKSEVVRRQRQLEAGAVLARARTAFRPNRYDECVKLCDQLLGEYVEVIDVSVSAKVRVLRQRAQFWGDVEQLSKLLAADQSDSGRLTLLRGFLDKYPDRRGRTTGELRELDRRRGQLEELEQRQAAVEYSRAGARQIEQLHRELPPGFSQRVASAVAIVDRYPAETVRTRLRSDVRLWLAEWLPEKEISEPPAMREVETKDNQVVRGFFKEVTDGEGRVIGYKRYPTHQQLLNPISEVGTYRADLLRGAPAESVPRRCVTRFNELRRRLLARPDQKQTWIEIARLCRQLDGELHEYRRKSGCSSEKLSFAENAEFANSLVNEMSWEGMQKLFGS